MFINFWSKVTKLVPKATQIYITKYRSIATIKPSFKVSPLKVAVSICPFAVTIATLISAVPSRSLPTVTSNGLLSKELDFSASSWSFVAWVTSNNPGFRNCEPTEKRNAKTDCLHFLKTVVAWLYYLVLQRHCIAMFKKPLTKTVIFLKHSLHCSKQKNLPSHHSCYWIPRVSLSTQTEPAYVWKSCTFKPTIKTSLFTKANV